MVAICLLLVILCCFSSKQGQPHFSRIQGVVGYADAFTPSIGLPTGSFLRERAIFSVSLSERTFADSAAATAVPRHVAYIVDGNGRWAAQQGKPRSFGHSRGANVTVEIVKRSFQMGVNYITLFLFSTENWSRPATEVQNIIELLHYYLTDFNQYLKAHKIRLRVIGQIEKLPKATQVLLKSVGYHSERDVDIDGVDDGCRTLCLAISYGGRDDIVSACKQIADKAVQNTIGINDITEEIFSQALSLGKLKIPDPDLLVRTSGELRLSNFLLWQCAYTEFASVPCLCRLLYP